MKLTPPEPWLMRRLILMPLAGSRGLDYETEAMTPGSSEVAQAYGFVSCGADLLVQLCYVEGFPSTDRRTTKRGMKWLRDGIISSAEPSLTVAGDSLRVLPGAQIARAQIAAVFLAQAMALNFEMMMRRAGDEYSENLHRSFRALIQRVYPLDDQALERQRELTVEYRVMEAHEVPVEVRAGVRGGTGYHMALMDDDFSEYENVDDDKHLVEIQERYSWNFLRSMANLYAIELIIGHDKLEKLEPKLLTPSYTSWDLIAQQFGDAAVWNSVAKDWHKHAERVVADDPPESTV